MHQLLTTTLGPNAQKAFCKINNHQTTKKFILKLLPSPSTIFDIAEAITKIDELFPLTEIPLNKGECFAIARNWYYLSMSTFCDPDNRPIEALVYDVAALTQKALPPGFKIVSNAQEGKAYFELEDVKTSDKKSFQISIFHILHLRDYLWKFPQNSQTLPEMTRIFHQFDGVEIQSIYSAC